MVKSIQKYNVAREVGHMDDKGEIIIYQSADGETGIEVKV